MNAEASFHFRPHHRLRTKTEFDRVFKHGRRRTVRGVSVYVCRSDCNYSRLGLATSRRLGNAVTRNRARRLIRESFRRIKATFSEPLDLIVRPEPGRFPDQQELVESAIKDAVALALKSLRQRNKQT